jgi:cephalosporin-C deacetylase-like acetyl esterase
MNRRAWSVLIVGGLAVGSHSAKADDPPPLADYFRAETAKITAKPLLGIDSRDAWNMARPELQRQLLETLGLWPMPPRGDLAARVTGTEERAEFVIDKILYQSIPGLYVTGNLYRPKVVTTPLPAILYVCGHSKVEKDGVIYGCKAHYQHHAAWFAANGYACLIVDTIELGELPCSHHGTCREGKWWWQSRGFTPAGIEAWNGLRAIDYLISRPDVDKSKIGVTGRSGGGATSWWLGAIDDRIAAVVPVAGITDLKNHVVDGVVEGHCDCMYPFNTFRWDFETLAALVAPKPMLVENTDKDPIFPEDGVRRIYSQLEKVYGWYGASDRLGLVIGKGGHADTTELRHPAFAFFEKWLKGKLDASINEPDRKVPIEILKVLKTGEIPPGAHNATMDELFVARANLPMPPQSRADWLTLRKAWMSEIRTKVFGGWPREGDESPLDPKTTVDVVRDGLRIRAIDFDSQVGVRLRVWIVSEPGRQVVSAVVATVADDAMWKERWSWLENTTRENLQAPDAGPLNDLKRDVRNGEAWVVVVPRGFGPTAWPAKKDTHIRRRFALLGQTLAGMQVWDIRRCLKVLHTLPDLQQSSIQLRGTRQTAPLAIWAAVFEPSVTSVMLRNPPTTTREGPAFQNLERILEMPPAVALLHPRRVRLEETEAEYWRWVSDLGRNLSSGDTRWPEFVPLDKKTEEPKAAR